MDTMDVNTAEDKKKRKRNKQVLKSIRQQVEFYFGDANLRKDRFLGQEISMSEDRYVDIEIIASFNRMQVLCSDPSLIAQAISTSDLLELNDDKTKIRRKVPLGDPEYDPDDVTVYVECLPKFVDHDWVRKVFGVCGSVEYVSLPRYKSSGDIKGFAFVEFKTPEEATRACEMLNNPPEEESDQVGKFPKTKGGRYVPIDEDKDDRTKDNTRTSHRKRSYSENDNKSDNHKRQKRRHRESESSDGKPDRDRRKRHHSDDLHKTKKEKAGQDDKKSERKEMDDVDSKEESKSKKDKERTQDSEENQVKSKTDPEKDDQKKESLKSRKRKLTESDAEEDLGNKKNRKESGGGEKSKGHEQLGDVDVSSNDEDDSKRDSDNEERRKKRSRKRKPEKKKEVKENEFQLKVISKKEWLDLKQKYLSLQKASIAKLKEAFRTGGVSNVIQSEKIIKSTEPEFTPGVVLKLESKTAVESRQQLKDDLQTCAPVAYIDIQPGGQSGFVRCKSTEGAVQILDKYGADQTDSNLSMTLLKGNEEEQYWEKLKADRMDKLTSKQKKKKKRGLDRVLCKAEKVSFAGSESGGHIRFDDD